MDALPPALVGVASMPGARGGTSFIDVASTSTQGVVSVVRCMNGCVTSAGRRYPDCFRARRHLISIGCLYNVITMLAIRRFGVVTHRIHRNIHIYHWGRDRIDRTPHRSGTVIMSDGDMDVRTDITEG